MKNHEKLEGVSVSLALMVGLALYQIMSKTTFPVYLNFIITFLASSAFYEFLFRFLIYLFSNVDFFLKILWGNLYLKGYWSYTYIINGEKKYGAWCIDQKYNSLTVKGFGISANDYTRRSDVQSLSELIKRNNDYEILNMRRDVNSDGAFPDEFFYSKTSLHMHWRNTVLNIMCYPKEMDGVTIIYGGALSGNHHGSLKFIKHEDAKTEEDIEKIVIEMIKKDNNVTLGSDRASR